MFHVELRQFPHTARAYNLSQPELHARFVAPWQRGRTVELDDLKFSPDRGHLTIFEGRRLEIDELGYGRGWGNAVKTGEDVTERELTTGAPTQASADTAVATLKRELTALTTAGPVTLQQALALATQREPQARLSQRLATAEQAIWELLHERRIALVNTAGGEPIPPEHWEQALLATATWFETPARLQLASADT